MIAGNNYMDGGRCTVLGEDLFLGGSSRASPILVRTGESELILGGEGYITGGSNYMVWSGA